MSIYSPIAALALAVATFSAAADPQGSMRFFDDAVKRQAAGDLAGAALQLKNAVQQDPANLAAQLMLGRVLLQAGENLAAEVALSEALKRGVSRTEVDPLLGQVYLRLNEPRKLLERVVAPDAPAEVRSEVMTMRGTARAMMGNFDGAGVDFAEARRLDPRSASPLVAESPVLMRRGLPGQALSVAEQATKLAPTSDAAWHQYGTLLQAAGRTKDALAAFDMAIAANAKHVDARISRAMTLLSLQRDVEAKAEIELLRSNKVVEPRASFVRGMIAARAGDAAAAKTAMSEAVSLIDAMTPAVLSASEPLLLTGALAHRYLGNLEKAREYLATLVERNSRHYAAAMMLGGVLLDAGDLRRAAPLIERVLSARPDDPEALYLMGSLMLARRQFEQAADVLDRAARAGAGNRAQRDLAFSQFGLGDDKTALANLERAVAADPSDTRAGIELAVVYARLGDATKASNIANGLVARDPANLALLNFLGNVKGRLGDLKGTREAYERALARDAMFRPVVVNMSWLDMDEGRIDAARERLQAFLRAHPKDGEVLFQLGLVEQRARRMDAALKHWADAQQAAPKDPRPGLAAVDLLLRLRRNADAVALAKALSARLPESHVATMALARAHMESGERLLARQALQKAVKLAEFDPRPLSEVARLQLSTGDADGAQYTLQKALDTAPQDPLLMSMMVEVSGVRRDGPGVDKALGELLARHPGHPLSQTTAGHVALSRGEFAKAVAAYRKAHQAEPSTPAVLNLARALVGAQQVDRARVELQAWSRKNPQDPVARRALADVLAMSGDLAGAREAYAALVREQADDANLLASYAMILARSQDPQALQMAERAYKLAPEQAALGDLYGWLLYQSGQFDAALRTLREARLRDPSNVQLRWHLAAVLTRLGRPDEARLEIRDALATGQAVPSDPVFQSLRQTLGL